jgi:electron transfer flavoprotein beta subunit
MKALICISHVPDTTTKIVFEADGKSLNKAGVTFIVNPYDEFGLSRAMEIKEKTNDCHITVICVGTAETEPTIRKALAVGADDAVRIDAQPTDAFFVATQIANWAQGKGYDLIFTGKESIDSNGSAVPGMLAELMDLPLVSFATKLETEGGKASIHREIDGGEEVMESALPVVITCQKGIAEWRIPNMRGIMAARTKPLSVVPPTGGDMRTRTVQFVQPPAKTGCQYVSAEQPEELVKLLADKGIL